MTINSRSAKLSSPNVKVQDVPNKPTIGAVTQDPILDAVNVSFTPATTGGRAAIYRAVSNPGNIEAISYGSSPVQVTGLTDGTAYTFTVRAESATGAATDYTSSSSSITPSFGSYDLIASNIFTGATSSVTFSSIPQDYKHLQIRAVINPSSGGWGMGIYFNGVTGNYSMHRMSGNGGGVYAGYTSSATNIQTFGFHNGGQTNVSMPIIIDIPEYRNTTKNKTIKTFTASAAGSPEIVMASGAWYSTAAINTVNIGFGGNGAVGTRFSLYGIKG
jgi:hypothetical protein